MKIVSFISLKTKDRKIAEQIAGQIVPREYDDEINVGLQRKTPGSKSARSRLNVVAVYFEGRHVRR